MLTSLALLRFAELVVSWRNWRFHHRHAKCHKEFLFPFMVLVHLCFFGLLPFEHHVYRPAIDGRLTVVATVVCLLALLLRAWTLRSMGKSWNVRIVYGETYPIVTNGPFRWIRHPNYLAVILELGFFPLIFGLYRSALILTCLNAVVLFFRIREEERLLEQNPEWQRTMGEKPRFLPKSIRGLPST